jgi:iron complex outermembrane recepter protein
VRRRTVDEWDAGWVPEVTRTSGAWTVTAGGEARLHEAHHVGDVRWAEHYPDGVGPDHRYYDYRVEKRTFALQATAAWRASARVSVTAGLQGTHHRYEMLDDKIEDVSFAESFTFVLPRLGAVVSLGEGAEAYANLARGMKEPAFRTIYDPQDFYGTRAALDPEDVWDLEAGAAVRRDHWRARANLFYMKFANEIVYAGALDDSGVPIYGNGARSIHRGVELEASASPSSRFGVDGSLTLSRNTFTEYSEQWAPGVEVVYDGNRTAGYPDLLASLTLRGSLAPVSWTLAARYAGRFFLDNSEDNRRNPEAREEPGYVPLVNDAYTVVDAALRLPLPEPWVRSAGLQQVTLELRCNNLLDATYTAFGYVDGGPQYIAAAGRSVYWGVTLGF